MHLIDFINKNKEWRTILTQPPYSFIIKDEDKYTLIKYTFGVTDFAAIGNLGLEARGIIIKNCDDTYKVVCHGLNKFFNKEEECAATIHWQDGVKVLEKMDGTNIRLWWDEGKWHISTLGAIYTEFEEMTKACVFQFQNYCDRLDKNCTYVYEMVGPQNRIVVHYKENALYFISKRNIVNGVENDDAPEALRNGVRVIPHYNCRNMWDTLKLLEGMDEEHEGVVVCDVHFNRVKLKTEWYLALHRVRGNGVLTVKRVVEMWQVGALDDYMAAFPEYNEFINNTLAAIKKLIEETEYAFHFLAAKPLSRKEFAAQVQKYAPLVQACCYALLDKKCANAYEFFIKMPKNKIVKYVEGNVKQKSYGVEEEM